MAAVLPLLSPNAAGVDISAREIFVAVPPDRDPEPVRSRATFTEDLYRLADWLKSCGIETVAMESTSVYWIPLFQILEARGFEVCLVNARYYQNVPGRRTDGPVRRITDNDSAVVDNSLELVLGFGTSTLGEIGLATHIHRIQRSEECMYTTARSAEFVGNGSLRHLKGLQSLALD